MASESGSPEFSSFTETLISSRNSEISLFLPFILGLNPTSSVQTSANPSPDSQDQDTPRESRDRIILINPFIQGVVVIERSSSGSNSDSPSLSSLGVDSLIDELFSRKVGQPPASKASIDALQSVEVVMNGENGDEQCVVCLEEWKAEEKAKQMPCKHMFHGGCIEKWLKIHGSCPVCRYEMPVDEADDVKKSGDGERRRGIWLGFFRSGGESADSNQTTVGSGINE